MIPLCSKDDADDDAYVPPTNNANSTSSRRNKYESDYESDDDEDEDQLLEESDLEADDVMTTMRPRRRARRNLSDEEEEEDVEPAAVFTRNTNTNKKTSNSNDNDSTSSFVCDDEVSSFEGDVEESSDENNTNCAPKKRRVSIGIMCHSCLSTRDSITNERLSSNHICWTSPDGQQKQCFAIETLYRISKSQKKKYWLQPPHFRSAMDDELVEQISDKFGTTIAHVFDHCNNVVTNEQQQRKFRQHADEYDDEEFEEAVNRYMYNCLGSRDVYCCPICYVQAIHIRKKAGNFICNDDGRDGRNNATEEIDNNSVDYDAGHNSESSDEGGEEEDTSWLDTVVSDIDGSDPMEALNSLDGGALQTASTICFRKLVDVKNHLKTVHMVDLSSLDNGNHLFNRFRVSRLRCCLDCIFFKCRILSLNSYE